jgi:hypothetical protein
VRLVGALDRRPRLVTASNIGPLTSQTSPHASKPGIAELEAQLERMEKERAPAARSSSPCPAAAAEAQRRPAA